MIKLIKNDEWSLQDEQIKALPIMTDSYLDQLISEHGDDIRTMETLLYDDYIDVEKGLQNKRFY